MLFNSIEFSVFLPIVFIIYWAIPSKYRWPVILIASYYFYMSWNPQYLILILLVTIYSYIGAISIEIAEKHKIKKIFVCIIIFISMGLLLVFKYWSFMIGIMERLFEMLWIPLHSIELNLILPVGISFYTFQALSYVIDVYRGDIKAERHLGKYAAFISFFPQLVAGPIERTENLLPQIKGNYKFDYQTTTYGLKIIAWGFFKKLVIADQLATFADQIFENVYDYKGAALLIASIFFTLQIYCDFSGYSDIAIGTARLFGIQLMQNFKSPYFASSFREFWKRWHISLSSWFQDYVYIPLGGNRVGKLRNCLNIMIVFLFSGLWHGAAWHFIVWGGVHGVLRTIENIVLEKMNKRKKHIRKWKKTFRWFLVFFIINLSWVFFRIEIRESCYMIANMFVGIRYPISYFYEAFRLMDMGQKEFLEICIFIVVLLIHDYIDMKTDIIQLISKQKAIVRWGIYYAIGLCILIWGIEANSTAFIYFQF